MTPVDPGPDPQFPDRPDTQDFRDLSRAIQSIDDDPREVPEILGVDMESLLYLAQARITFCLLREPAMAPVAIYLDAFTLGKTLAENRAKEQS